MRKRLRKKKHVGEFQEFGMELSIDLYPGTDFDSFFYAFIGDAVEANGLLFGGGGMDLNIDGFLLLGRRPIYEAKRDKVLKWLSVQEAVRSFEGGQPVDAWYPP